MTSMQSQFFHSKGCMTPKYCYTTFQNFLAVYCYSGVGEKCSKENKKFTILMIIQYLPMSYSRRVISWLLEMREVTLCGHIVI